MCVSPLVGREGIVTICVGVPPVKNVTQRTGGAFRRGSRTGGRSGTVVGNGAGDGIRTRDPLLGNSFLDFSAAPGLPALRYAARLWGQRSPRLTPAGRAFTAQATRYRQLIVTL